MKKITKIILILFIFLSNFQVVFAEETSLNSEEENVGEVVEDNNILEEEIEENVNTFKEEEIIEENRGNIFYLSDNKVIDDIKISVEGEFAEEGHLFVEKVALNREFSNDNVAEQYTFDVKIFNIKNEEIQPLDKVNISFEFAKIDDNLTVEVFHEEEPLDVITEDNTITVETDGFSLYTVEFTYNNKQYVLEGDTYVKLDDILSFVELSGNIESYEVSNEELFNVFLGDEDGVEYIENYDDNGNLVEYCPINKEDGNILYMVALQPFTSEEWLKVVIDGIEYTIVVTDAIRVNENGDQISTSVRYISTTSSASSISTGTNSAITDARVIQGPTEENFTASMPLAEIYIDDTIVNQSLWKNDDLNGTRVIAELLVDNTQGKYKGFKINSNPEVAAGNSMASSYGALYYDFSERYLNDTQTLTVSGSSANNYEKFSGDIVRYTLKGMATKFDPVANEYKNYDVVITYSDLLITLAQNSGTGSVNQANISDKLMLIDTNMVNFKWSGGFRAGLEYNVNVKVVDPDTGELIDGSYYYPMTDIDVGRTGIGGFANLYNAANVSRYSEQIALLSNYGRPTSSGSWEQKVWIPGGNWSQTPVTNLSNITDEAFPYACKISPKTIDGQANTMVIEPSRPNGGMIGAIASAKGQNPDPHDNSFYSGFITLANNTAGGINIKGWASAPTSGGVESYVLTGSQIVNHKVDASSNVGGTIFTTTTGNADGKLSGGTLLGYDEINKPFELSAATGQSVTYTMTPKGGYKLSKVWVKDTDIDIMSIVNNAKATVNESDFDENNDGTIDENERVNYKTAVNQAVNNALSGQDAVEVPISDLQSLGKGVYAYTFNGIQTDKSIHIEWENTDLTVTKKLNPSMSGITDKFKFQIKLSDTSTEETTWRVRAKKNTGKLSYHNPYFADYVNTTYYFGYWEGHEETLPYSYVEVTETEDKNPYEEGWYIYHNGSYMSSYDTTVAESTTYYQRDDIQTSTVTNYYYHLLGWNESTNSWEDKVVPATSGSTDGAVLGLENLDTELPDYYRYNYDETVVNNENYYNEETGTYDKYLMWIPDTTTGKQMLVVGNAEEYPNGTAFAMGDYYAYIYQEGIENYSGKVLKSGPSYIDINGVSYRSNHGGTGYWYTQDDTTPIYYNLINNSNGYNLNSGYTPLEGESGMYIITLPAGQTPNTDDLTADGWDVTVSRVGAIEDDFDLEAAMIAAGAKSVSGAVNTFEFELGVDDTIDFNGVIPMGYDYEITEIIDPNGKWLKISNTPNAVITDFDGEEEVTFTNTEKTFDVSIEKQTVDNVAGTFDFTIEIYKENITPGQVQAITIQTYKNSEDTNVTYKLTNTGNPIDIDMNGVSTTIPTGDSYLSDGGPIGTLIGDLITLDNTTPNSIVMNGLAGEIKAEASMSVYDEVQEVINEGNDSFSLEPTAFELKTPNIIDKVPYNPPTVPTGFSGSNGVFTTTLSNGDIKTFINIPFGYKYEITETLPQGWENESKINETGILTTDDVISTWVNKQKSYSLTINKETVNNDSGTFNFEVKVWKNTNYLDLSSLFSPKTDSNNDGIADDGIYKFTLTNGASNTIPNIPYGYSYEVYEVDSNGNRVLVGSNIDSTDWKLKSIDGNNTETITDDTNVTFNNELVHDLTITKETSGNVEGTFNFKIKAWEEEKETVDEYINRTEAYTVFDSSDGSLTFFRDEKNKYTNNQVDETKTYYTGIETNTEIPAWASNSSSITSVTFDDVIKPISTASWFYGCSALTTINGLDKLDTSKVTDMSGMFINCSSLTSIDVSHFDTSNVTGDASSGLLESGGLSSMFRGCTNLETLDLSHFNTSNVVTAENMFSKCVKLNTSFTLMNNFHVIGKELLNPAASTFGSQISLKYLAPATSEHIDSEISQKHKNSNIINSGEGTYIPPLPINYDASKLGTKPTAYLDLTQYGDVTTGFNNEYTFSLENGESLTLSDLPHGIKYEVYEETKDGWKLVNINGNSPSVSKGAGGTSGVLNEDKEEIFNNTPLYDIEVNKTVTGLKGDKNKDFEFTVKVWKEYDLHTVFGNYLDDWRPVPVYLYENMNLNRFTQVDAGTDQYTYSEDFASTLPTSYKNDKRYTQYVMENGTYEPLADYKEVDVDIVIDGVKYEKVLANADMLESNSWGSEEYPWFYVLLDKGEDFNHTRPTGDLPSITDSNYDTMTIIDGYLDLSSYGGIDNGDGTYTFKLKDGENFTLEDIPYGYTYEIIEKDYSSDMYTTTVDSVNTREVTGTVDSNKTHEYINDKDFADLTITKNVSGNMGNKNKDFKFTIKVSKLEEVFKVPILRAEYDDDSGYGGRAWIDAHEGLKKLSDVKKDGKYRLYVCDMDNPVDISSDAWALEEYNKIVNSAGYYRYLMNDETDAWIIDDKIAIFGVKETITQPEYAVPFPKDAVGKYIKIEEYNSIDLTQYGGIDNGDDSYTFTLKHGESLTLPNLPAGYNYEVEETDYSSEGYITSVDGKKGRTITGVINDDIIHVFENKNQVAVPTEVRVNSWLFGASLIMIALISFIKNKYRRVS